MTNAHYLIAAGFLLALFAVGGLLFPPSPHPAYMDCESVAECLFTRYISPAIERGGITEGLTTFEGMYRRTLPFRSSCHRSLIRVTRLIYEKYPDAAKLEMSPRVALCNYAFLQQYPVSLLQKTQDVAEARTFCENVGNSLNERVPGAQAECYRGYGRGLPYLNPLLADDLEQLARFGKRQCSSISEKDLRLTCLSGLYNQLGRAPLMGELRISPDPLNPLLLCEKESNPEVRSICFGNYKAAIVESGSSHLAQKLEELRKAYGGTESYAFEQAIEALGYKAALTGVSSRNPIKAGISYCEKFGGSAAACVRGYSVGLAKNGIPWQQHEQVLAFCERAHTSFSSLDERDCPATQAMGYLHGFHTREAYRNICTKTEERLGFSCPSLTRKFGH